MADTSEPDTAHQEKAADEDVKGFKNDGSFLEQFRKLQDQKKAEVPSEKQQTPVRSIPVKLHVCALKKPTSRLLPKKSLEAKKAFDGDEEDPNTEPSKEAAPTVCEPSFSAAEGRLAAELSVEAPDPKEGTRKRKSRWSEPPSAPTAILRTGSGPITPNTSSAELSEAQRQQLLEQIEINRIVAEIRAARQKRGNNKYDYDSDEDVQDGTWEHKLRAREMIETEDKARLLTETAKGKHHIGDFLPPEELEKFVEKVQAKKEGREADISDYKTHKLSDDNIGYKMLQKAGWKEGSGLGTSGAGIVAPINKGRQSFDQSGLGTDLPGEVEKDDDAFETYRKRMMLAYRFRPNPLNNPRRPYY